MGPFLVFIASHAAAAAALVASLAQPGGAAVPPARTAALPATACDQLTETGCAFAASLDDWFATGDTGAIVTHSAPRRFTCPGPTANGLGGPYPLCEGGRSGEVRNGFPIVHLASEGDIVSAAGLTDELHRWLTVVGAGTPRHRLVTVGCPLSGCAGGFSAVFSDGVERSAGGTSFWSVLVFVVERQPNGSYAVTSLIGGPIFGTPALPAELGGGAVQNSPLLTVIDDATLSVPFGQVPGTFYTW